MGAGGLSNALPELVNDCEMGALIELRDIHVLDNDMSPMEIWCNESQERYVLGIKPEYEEILRKICEREKCPLSIAGTVTKEQRIIVTDRFTGIDVINLSTSVLFGKPPRMYRKDVTKSRILDAPNLHVSGLGEIIERILLLPCVSSKSFLITIGDRSVTGLVCRDQMVGPYQVPISDVAVTASSYYSKRGEAMCMGERPILAICNPAASGRMAFGEAITNLAASYIGKNGLCKVAMSANWMCSAGKEGEGKGLYDTVKALSEEMCIKFGVTIPVGKDSMSMQAKWSPNGAKESRVVSSPLSLVITAYAPVEDVSRTWTPDLKNVSDESCLLLVDLAKGKTRLGGSALYQVYGKVGSDMPDGNDAPLDSFFEAM